MKILLHVGCGSSNINNLPVFFRNGDWEEIRYDIDSNALPDILGNMQDMSLIEDFSVDAIYSSHNIEHVWDFEVEDVLREFRRVLKPDGFALILCPDIMSVAQSIVQGDLNKSLYKSPVGDIFALDIIYGYRSDIKKGNLFMAHKTAFTDQALADHLINSGFSGAVIARDKFFGLHAVAFLSMFDNEESDKLVSNLLPDRSFLLEVNSYKN